MKQTLALLIALFLLKPAVSTKCDSFRNVEMTVRSDEGDSYNTTVNGCIERVAFDKVITQAHVRYQKIPRLGRDSVRNMKHLHAVSFYQCQIATVEAGAFRNIPNLKSIQIVGNELVRISQGIFSLAPNLEILKLNKNKIEIVENGGFADIPALKKIYVSNNQLKTWDREWFANTTALQVIDFQFNKIKILPKRAFYGFEKLKEIYFDFNELQTIQSEVFKGLTRLQYLGLKYNRLRVIDSRVFPNEVAINSMTIDANYLNYLAKDLLAKITVKELSLEGNPWKCPCLRQISIWLHETNATVKNSNSCTGSSVPVCSFPSSQSRTCIETVDEDVTSSYFQELRRIDPPLNKYCARLD